jgi:hypothetical protein
MIIKHYLEEIDSGNICLDLGGGKYDKNTNFFNAKGIFNYVYDLYNRSQEHNEDTLKSIKNGADFTIISNVLNVIKEESEQIKLLEFAKQHTNGCIYISVYEGNKSGIGKMSKEDCFQHNKRTTEYMKIVQSVFKNVTIKYGIIIANW